MHLRLTHVMDTTHHLSTSAIPYEPKLLGGSTWAHFGCPWSLPVPTDSALRVDSHWPRTEVRDEFTSQPSIRLRASTPGTEVRYFNHFRVDISRLPPVDAYAVSRLNHLAPWSKECTRCSL